MTATEALAEIKAKAAGGQVRFTAHAYLRMRDRSATARDVVRALVTATRASEDGVSKYKVSGGSDLDGDDLTVIVVLEADVLVVTLF